MINIFLSIHSLRQPTLLNARKFFRRIETVMTIFLLLDVKVHHSQVTQPHHHMLVGQTFLMQIFNNGIDPVFRLNKKLKVKAFISFVIAS